MHVFPPADPLKNPINRFIVQHFLFRHSSLSLAEYLFVLLIVKVLKSHRNK